MSIFEKFNNQGLNDEDAFEELCCQLFETWGINAMGFDYDWTFSDIRGDGGDGGIEAYWLRGGDENTTIGIQAKWFRKTLTSSQYKQLEKSIETAVKLRPGMKQYIVCIPHDLTDLRKGLGGRTLTSERAKWTEFKAKITSAHPNLDLKLWDEHIISDLLQDPSNEGRHRLWFEHSAINPEAFRLGLAKSLERLKEQYIPVITDDGETIDFLDEFFGTLDSRKRIVLDIDSCSAASHELEDITRSFVEAGSGLSGEVIDAAERYLTALDEYVCNLAQMRKLATNEPRELRSLEITVPDYSTFEKFENVIQGLKPTYRLPRHVDELLARLDEFRELPDAYDICSALRKTYSFSHCLIIGEQGTGKTCGFANEAYRLSSADMHLPILVRAADIRQTSGWKEIISNALGLEGWDSIDLWQALSSSAAIRDLHEGGFEIRAKVAILVDGLDERPPASGWTDLIRQADAISTSFPRIRFAFSARPGGVVLDKSDCQSACTFRLDDDGDAKVTDLFDRYIDYYKIDLCGINSYKWMLQTPMELRMFCTAYKGMRLDGDVSTCLTDLIDAEINRLEYEYANRVSHIHTKHSGPIRKVLLSLAQRFLLRDNPLDLAGVGSILDSSGIPHDAIGITLDFLEGYGVIVALEHRGETRFSPPVIEYKPGSRHLWDYFMACLLLEMDDTDAAGYLLNHVDAAGMYAILLIERKGFLPSENQSLINILGEERCFYLSLRSLASSKPEATGRYKQWALDIMSRDKKSLYEVLNLVIARVSSIPNHPLGPLLLDEYLRSFSSPVERDLVWSLPRKSSSDPWLSIYFEREATRNLPYLSSGDRWNQMPLIHAWCLASVSNLRRGHCRDELVKWGLGDPDEFALLFERFATCDDPQVREDMYAMAEEIVCNGNLDTAAETKLAALVFDSLFACPDTEGNRDAALRFYGRILLEKCHRDGLLDEDKLRYCRPPYVIDNDEASLRIYPDASEATEYGYGSIHYDLARYVLIDHLESAFEVTAQKADSDCGDARLVRLISISATEAKVKHLRFDGWVIAAVYRYLIDHGYDREVLEGPKNEDDLRIGGVDSKISAAFGRADHGLRSLVMTVAEKYTWCARSEICGFLADRIPSAELDWYPGATPYRNADGLSLDYSFLLDYDSPLLELTIHKCSSEYAGAIPVYPEPFGCAEDAILAEESELLAWVEGSSASDAISLLDYMPPVRMGLNSDTLPMSLYACDWGIGGKSTCAWIYAGIVSVSDLDNLRDANDVCVDGCSQVSGLEASIPRSPSVFYISPVEYIHEPWVSEVYEDDGVEMIGDARVKPLPFSTGCVARLIDVGDYWYSLPSKRARALGGVTGTDGVRYFDKSGSVVFEDVRFGVPYKREYRSLLGDREQLYEALEREEVALVWYATVRRSTNSLAKERIPDLKECVEKSWLIWTDPDGGYSSLPVLNGEAECL